MVPDVTPLDHRHVLTGPPHHHGLADRRAAVQRAVGALLQRDDTASAPAAVGSDQYLGIRIVDAIPQRIGGEATEDHRMDGADPRTGEHRNGELGYHPEVDRHTIAAADSDLLQTVGETTDLLIELAVRDAALVAGLAFPEVGDAVGMRL
jgi:hypothetical protein